MRVTPVSLSLLAVIASSAGCDGCGGGAAGLAKGDVVELGGMKLKVESVTVNGMPADKFIALEQKELDEANANQPLHNAPRSSLTIARHDEKLGGAIARPATSSFSWLRPLRSACGASDGGAMRGCGLVRAGDEVFALAQTPEDDAAWPPERPLGTGSEGFVGLIDDAGRFADVWAIRGFYVHGFAAADAGGVYVVGRAVGDDADVNGTALRVARGFGRFRLTRDGKVSAAATMKDGAELENAVGAVDGAGNAVFVGGGRANDGALTVVAVGMNAAGQPRFTAELSKGNVPYVDAVVTMPDGGAAVVLFLPGDAPELVFLDDKGTIARRGPYGAGETKGRSNTALSSWSGGAAVAYVVDDQRSDLVLFDATRKELRRHQLTSPKSLGITALNADGGGLVVGVKYVGSVSVDGNVVSSAVDDKRVPVTAIFVDATGAVAAPTLRGDNTYVDLDAAVRRQNGAVVGMGTSRGGLVVDEELAIEGRRDDEVGHGRLPGQFLFATRAAAE